MGEVFILSIPDISLLFTFTTIINDKGVTENSYLIGVVVALSLSIRKVVSPRPVCAGYVKPKTLK
jgi:hypothetical protein